jgi:hypothetical protein
MLSTTGDGRIAEYILCTIWMKEKVVNWCIRAYRCRQELEMSVCCWIERWMMLNIFTAKIYYMKTYNIIMPLKNYTNKSLIKDLKLSWWLNSINSSWATNCVLTQLCGQKPNVWETISASVISERVWSLTADAVYMYGLCFPSNCLWLMGNHSQI